MADAGIEQMVGLTFVEVAGCEKYSERLMFQTAEGRKFVFCHSQECCEIVRIEQVDGAPGDLLGSPLVMAEASSEDVSETEGHRERAEWTFYKFATVKGYVTVRWLGESNGYYGVGVSITDGSEE